MAADYTLHAALKGGAPTQPAEGFALAINGPYELNWKEHMRREFIGGGHKSYEGPDRIVTHHVGEVSWLKAALLEDSPRYVPSLIGMVSEIIPELSTGTIKITNELIAEVKKAIIGASQVEDSSIYEQGDPEALLLWLDSHKDWEVWSVSW